MFLYHQVFAIGIGSGVDKAELRRIATDNQHVFQVNNFDALSTLQAELKKTACTSKNRTEQINALLYIIYKDFYTVLLSKSILQIGVV